METMMHEWRKQPRGWGQTKTQVTEVPAVDKYVAWQTEKEEEPGGGGLSIQTRTWRGLWRHELVSGLKKWTSLHEGSVNDWLDVVLSVSRIDDPLSFGVLFDVTLCEELEAHVWRYGLWTKQDQKYLLMFPEDTLNS